MSEIKIFKFGGEQNGKKILPSAQLSRAARPRISAFIESLFDTLTILVPDAYPLLQSTENLFVDFLSTIAVDSVGIDALDQVAELEALVASHVVNLESKKGAYKIVESVSCDNDTLSQAPMNA